MQNYNKAYSATSLMFQPEWLQQFPQVEFGKHHTFIQQNAPVPTLYYIHDGIVKMQHIHDDGKLSIINLATPGCVVPLGPALIGTLTQYECVALTPVTAWSIPTVSLEKLLVHKPELYPMLLHKFLKAMEVFTEQIIALKGNMADKKIALTLHQLNARHCEIHGKKLADLLTHEEIAEIAGVSRETVSRYLSL